MTFHVAFRGKLVYADASAARAAFDALLAKQKKNTLLPEIVSLRGKSIVAKYASFVSFSSDIESVQAGLQATAEAATSGRILFDGEGGEKLAMEPTRRIGRTPRKREYVATFGCTARSTSRTETTRPRPTSSQARCSSCPNAVD